MPTVWVLIFMIVVNVHDHDHHVDMLELLDVHSLYVKRKYTCIHIETKRVSWQQTIMIIYDHNLES